MYVAGEKLKGWFKDLRDNNTRLRKPGKSGAAPKLYTDREKWILNKFQFLAPTMRLSHAPVTSVSVTTFSLYVERFI